MKSKDIKKHKANPYKLSNTAMNVKDVDTSGNVITGLFNSYFYIDSDLDMLLPGAAKKSIQERGVGTTKGNKIKHLVDHDWTKVVARIDVLEEKAVEFEGKTITGIYHESFFDPSITDSADMFKKIQAGYYDSRSIGFQYVNLVLAERDGDEEELKNWEQFYPKALNPEIADQAGYFWAVKEVKLWEGSDVAFGANEFTPMLGTKSLDRERAFNRLKEKIDIAHKLFKSGNLTDEGYHVLEMEMSQIKSYLIELENSEPGVKDTIADSRKAATKKRQEDVSNFYKHLK